MSILSKIRSLFGGEDIPAEAEEIYRLAKSETEALTKLESERGRADRHRGVLKGDILALSGEEERLIEEGRADTSSVHRRLLAKEIAEMRSKSLDLMNRVDILTRRISVFDRQVALLRDRAVLSAPLPASGEIEQRAEDALVARREFEELSDLSDLHRDVSRLSGRTPGEDEVLREMEDGGEEELSFDEMVRQEEARQGRKPRGLSEDGREAIRE